MNLKVLDIPSQLVKLRTNEYIMVPKTNNAYINNDGNKKIVETSNGCLSILEYQLLCFNNELALIPVAFLIKI